MNSKEMITICKYELDWLDMKINVNRSARIRIGDKFNADVCPVTIDATECRFHDRGNATIFYTYSIYA